MYSISHSKLQSDLRISQRDLKNVMTAWDFFDPVHSGFIEIHPEDKCSELVEHIGPPLGKKAPVPDYWLESLRLQLLRKSKKNRITGARHVELMDFMVCL